MNIIKNLKQDLKAVSPIIGVILMVAITVVMAAIIGMFVFDIMPDEPAPVANIDIIVDGVQNFRVEHLRGETIMNMYNGTRDDWDQDNWIDMQVKINGVTVGRDAPIDHVADLRDITNEFNDVELPTHETLSFFPGDVLRFEVDGTPDLTTGDVITVVHVPSGTVLAREVVAL